MHEAINFIETTFWLALSLFILNIIYLGIGRYPTYPKERWMDAITTLLYLPYLAWAAYII